jgi:hypothetical protein
MNDLVNGIYNDGVMYGVGSIGSSVWLKFEFGSAAIVTGFKSIHQVSGWGGIWNFQGSIDDASYTTLWTGNPIAGGAVLLVAAQTYRFYRFVGVSGIAAGPMLYEVQFVVAKDLCQTVAWTSQSMLRCLTLSHDQVFPNFVEVTIGALVGTGAALFTFDGMHGYACKWR